ncbi:hypothetical protein EJ02DRAFT_456415 [Clathrospora elynae]|uniref:Uncharacterized protein n=1 Tax=Clathrospora elynae TaxID=706981 RepID=A0A6A5SH42_9PLEO|nr:hypothetical protein EJ02DRAFT_456415 [Clathrospora elynae]
MPKSTRVMNNYRLDGDQRYAQLPRRPKPLRVCRQYNPIPFSKRPPIMDRLLPRTRNYLYLLPPTTRPKMMPESPGQPVYLEHLSTLTTDTHVKAACKPRRDFINPHLLHRRSWLQSKEGFGRKHVVGHGLHASVHPMMLSQMTTPIIVILPVPHHTKLDLFKSAFSSALSACKVSCLTICVKRPRTRRNARPPSSLISSTSRRLTMSRNVCTRRWPSSLKGPK